MNANSFGLFSALAAILNSGKHDSDYSIAYYLASHADELDSVGINDIMAECFVTRSAVRRFCNRIGFLSFSEFKECMTSAAYPSDLNHRDLSMSIPMYREALDRGLAGIVASLAQTVDDGVIEQLTRSIHDHQHVVLVCAANTSGVLTRFQQELFFSHKIVQVIDDTYHERLQEVIASDNCLMIVVSASGVFANSLPQQLFEGTATTCLVTAVSNFANKDLYDCVVCMTSDSIESDSLGLYGKYGVSYVFDLLSACYLNRYVLPHEVD